MPGARPVYAGVVGRTVLTSFDAGAERCSKSRHLAPVVENDLHKFPKFKEEIALQSGARLTLSCATGIIAPAMNCRSLQAYGLCCKSDFCLVFFMQHLAAYTN